MLKRCAVFLGVCVALAMEQGSAGGDLVDHGRLLPPKAVGDLSEEQERGLEKRLAEVTEAFQAVKGHARAADAEIFLKAVRYALEFHEWYDENPDVGVRKAEALLDEAEKRIAGLKAGKTPWMVGSGQKVWGFHSGIDGSAQPYGVEIPDGLAWGPGAKAVPIWIWLHGRGDTTTDLNFTYGRLTAQKPGRFRPEGTIVIHPFGRYCNGWKSAGETDVLEAREDAWLRFNDASQGIGRVALAGFSMGGAGAWHLGAHFADLWSCVHAGAGFVDVRRYQKLSPENLPPWYEQKLWGVYDVPDAARNFLNVPLVCYSGEVDVQRDAAEYMMEVFAKDGFHPPHVIGPGMGHKYDPGSLQEVQGFIEKAVANDGRTEPRLKVSWQGRSLLYGSMHWIVVFGLQEHWVDSWVDARCTEDGEITVATKNIAEFGLVSPFLRGPGDPGAVAIRKVVIDGQEVPYEARSRASSCRRYRMEDGKWRPTEDRLRGWKSRDPADLRKVPGCCGPIDDAFRSKFLVVLPDRSGSSAVDRWVEAEAAHFLVRWRSLMRGDARVKRASEVTEKEITDSEGLHLVLWGTPRSNPLIARVLPGLPLGWDAKEVRVGAAVSDPRTSVPVLIYPNPLSRFVVNYVVLNSGLTFREAHDKTNSLQNPKLPDWAILDVTGPADGERAGKGLAADFFDEHWQVKQRLKDPADRE